MSTVPCRIPSKFRGQFCKHSVGLCRFEDSKAVCCLPKVHNHHKFSREAVAACSRGCQPTDSKAQPIHKAAKRRQSPIRFLPVTLGESDGLDEFCK